MLRPFVMEDETARKILKNRAEQLAGVKQPIQKEEADLALVEFKLAQERYGVELAHISGVHPLTAPAFLPGTPDFIKGIINVHGRIVSLVDLKKFFDLPETESNHRTRVIILASEKMEFGILADEILGVRRIPKRIIQPSLPTLTGIRAAYLKGVIGDGMVLLDGARLLADKKMVIDHGVSG